MDFRIEWSPAARLDFRDLLVFIAEDKPRTARKFRRKILHHINQLKTHPRSGRMVPEFNDDAIREVIEGPYRIVYRIKGEAHLQIVRVWHAARGIPDV